MSNEKKVWVCFINNTEKVNGYAIESNFPDVFDYRNNHKLGKIVDVDVETEELKIWREQNQKIIIITNTYHMFKKLEVLPDKLYLDESYSLKYPKKSDYICVIGNGFILVNETCANLLKKFRLGETTFTPVQIHKLPTDELLSEETFYFLNICERRQYMSEVQMDNGLKQLDYEIADKRVFKLPGNLNNHMVEVESQILDCDLDLWHDTSLKKSIFISDALHDALADAGMADLWNMHSCKIN